MSDTSYDPTEQDFDPVSFVQQQRRRTMANALTSLDASPEDAARAQDLSQATGAPPALVYGDLENFEQQHKAALTATLLKNNSYLSQYADSHPLAAKVSNDDWGNLDSLSQTLSKYWDRGKPRTQFEQALRDTGEQVAAGATGQEVLAGARAGFGEAPVGSMYQEGLATPESKKFISEHPFIWSLLRRPYIGEMTHVELGIRTLGAITGAAVQPALTAFHNITGAETPTVEQFMNEILPGLISAHVEMPEENAKLLTPETQKTIQALKAVEPWIQRNEIPPVGIDPLVDQAHSDQAKLDIKGLDETFKEAQASATRERSPELFANFIRQHTEGNIGISAEAVRKLYGDKVPSVDDNLLGWVPGIQDQLALAETHGGDIEVPLADWLAKVDPEVAKELHDNIRVRPGGMTLEETKEPAAAEEIEPKTEEEEAEQKPAIAPELAPVDSLRRAAKLDTPDALITVGAKEPGGPNLLPEKLVPGAKVESHLGYAQALHTTKVSELVPKLDLSELDDSTQHLAKFFGNRIMELAGDTPIHIIDQPTMAKLFPESPYAPGYYYQGNIVLRSDVVNGGLPSRIQAHVILHEAAHAMSVDSLYNFPELKSAVRNIMDETSAFLIKNKSDAFHEHHYAFSNEKEFVAEALSKPAFQKVLQDTPIPERIAKGLGLSEKRNTIWDAVKNIMKDLWTRLVGKAPDNSVMDAMFRIGEVLEEANKVLKQMADQEAAGAEEVKPPIGKGIVPRTPRYMELITERNEKDLEFQKAQAEKVERQRQTAEWKENFQRVRGEEAERIKQRPDIAADIFLRTGEADGQKFGKVRLDQTKIDPELRKSIPPDYLGPKGIDPDLLAGKFGYQSGDAMVQALGRLADERELEDLTPAAHLNRLVDAEADRRMRRDYGNLEQNILDEAKDHVLSQTQMDLLHEETLALGMQTGASPLNKDAIKAGLREQFDKTPLGSHNSDKYMAAAGRAGARAEAALLEDNPTEAYKAKQQQYYATVLASYARQLEKERGQFDRRVKNWRRREPSGIDQQDAVWIHQILGQIGLPPMRLVQDLDRQKALTSPYKNLREYVEGTNELHGLANQDVDALPAVQQLNVADFLFTDNYRAEVEQMTPTEFRDVFNSLKSIDHYARDTKKLEVRGKKEDLNEVVSGLIERLKAAVGGKPITEAIKQKTSAGRLVGTWLLNPETWMNRLDLGNRMGPFNQLIIRPITEGQYQLRGLEREFSKQWRELGDFPDLRKKIDNPLFRDPQTGDQIQMTRENAYAVLQNMGNELQRKKLVLGWRVHKDPEIGTQMIWSWLHGLGFGPEDISRAQKMGDMFNNAFGYVEKAYTHTAGVAPQRIELKTVQTPWGEMKEWYHPLIPDPLRHDKKLTAADLMDEGQGFFRPSTTASGTKQRTGALYPIDLTFDSVPFKLKQLLNDAAMRVPVSEVSKIVYHNDFKAAFKKYYGQEYASALDAWMKDVAGNRQWVPGNMRALDKAVNTLQQNLGTLLIGWNLGTVAKHAPTAAVFSAAEVGPLRFAQSAMKMIGQLPGSREAWNFMMENSEELQNRMRSLEDTLIAQNRESFKKIGWSGKFASFRDAVEWYGHAPVAFTDLISAVAMGHAEYMRLAEEQPELSHGDIMNLVNTAIRRTHGSSILSNRAGIMRYNSPFARLIVPFYTFMSNALQRNYELAWKSKLAMVGRDLPEMTGFEREQFNAGPQHIKSIIGGLMVYGVMVSLIEQMVDPLPDDKKENRVFHWAKILTRGYPSMIPVVRDAVNYLEQGHEPSVGLYGTLMRNVDKGIDPKSYTHNPGKMFRTLNSLFGTLTGLTFEPIGKAGEFTFNVQAGLEHPKNMGDLFKGLYKGTLKEPRR